MIITKPREWARIKDNLHEIGAKTVFLMGCGECATVAHTGGQAELIKAKAALEAAGFEVTGWSWAPWRATRAARGWRCASTRRRSTPPTRCSCSRAARASRRPPTPSRSRSTPGSRACSSATSIRHGVFEERCQMCGDCVLDKTAGICPVTTCPEGAAQRPVRRHVGRQVRGPARPGVHARQDQAAPPRAGTQPRGAHRSRRTSRRS